MSPFRVIIHQGSRCVVGGLNHEGFQQIQKSELKAGLSTENNEKGIGLCDSHGSPFSGACLFSGISANLQRVFIWIIFLWRHQTDQS